MIFKFGGMTMPKLEEEDESLEDEDEEMNEDGDRTGDDSDDEF